jgi:hypothetical protein
LVIGNFLPDVLTNIYFPDNFANAAYYYIDDVRVIKASQLTSTIALVNAKPSFTVHPNPATDRINLDYNHPGNGDIVITNPLGQTVFQSKSSGTHQAVDVSNFPNGIYIVQLITNGSASAQQKFVVLR